MIADLTIPRKVDREKSTDYKKLYAEGIERIQSLIDDRWSDFNVHDPGVTILEYLSYALTDLSYRSQMPIEDLLASEVENSANMRAQFFSAATILPSRPVTVLDYRKLLIDLPGVKNAWLEPAELIYHANKVRKELLYTDDDEDETELVGIHGLYNVLIDFHDQLNTTEKNAILRAVEDILQSHRNLCEDFVDFTEVPSESFLLCGEIELAVTANVASVKADILYRVQRYLAPIVQNYTLDEMLVKTKADNTPYTIDEIFEGPLLRTGFIPDDELTDAELKSQVRLSDIINIIMDIDGVVAVKDIIVNPVGLEQVLSNKWLVDVRPGHKIVLDRDQSRLVFYKKNMPIIANEEQAALFYDQLISDEIEALEIEADYDLPLPEGRFRKPNDYYAFQNHLPAIYGISEEGLPANASEQRKSEALQLKGYLLHFEQILANYLAQLAKLPQLFSSDSTIQQTYFYQAVDTFADWQKIYSVNDPVSAFEDRFDAVSSSVKRRHLFLDHLIARFAEDFSEFSSVMDSAFSTGNTALIQYKCDFINHYPAISMNRGGAYNYSLDESESIWNSDNISGLEARLCKLLGINNSARRNLSDVAYDIYAEIDTTPDDEFRFRIRNKDNRQILLSSSTNYVTEQDARREMRQAILLASSDQHFDRRTTSNGRFYFNIVDATNEVVARRIQYFLTEEEMDAAIVEVIQYMRINYSDEGLYLIENILLRPEEEGDPFLPICVDTHCQGCADIDPYSYRLHIVLPAYGVRFANMDFRQYAESIIRREVPAHILPKICWINKDDMAALESAYQSWLEIKHGVRTANRQSVIERLVSVLYSVKNVYPSERLRDCVDSEGNPEELPKFILGSTAIGSLDNNLSSNHPTDSDE